MEWYKVTKPIKLGSSILLLLYVGINGPGRCYTEDPKLSYQCLIIAFSKDLRRALEIVEALDSHFTCLLLKCI